MSLKTRLSQIELRFDAMKPPGRVFVVWDDDEIPEIGPDDTLIHVVHCEVKSIEDEAARQAASWTKPKRFGGR